MDNVKKENSTRKRGKNKNVRANQRERTRKKRQRTKNERGRRKENQEGVEYMDWGMMADRKNGRIRIGEKGEGKRLEDKENIERKSTRRGTRNRT
jgi:hypothetical protein